MTLPTGNNRICGGPAVCPAGFTLIELILVMAMLMVVLGLAWPSLKGFLHGRSLESEARRFLSLTRYGQSRAASEGVPMELWIDAHRGMYGLRAASSYLVTNSQNIELTLPEDMEIEVAPAVAGTSFGTQSRLTGASAIVGARAGMNRMSPMNTVAALPRIRFLPEGFVGEASPHWIRIREETDDGIWILQSTNRLNYEIRSSQSITNRTY